MDDERLGRGVSFPVTVDPFGRVASSSGAEKIRQSVLLILGTEPGERLMRPDFGCPFRSLVFEPDTPSTARVAEFRVREALVRWEPRIEVQSVVVDNRVQQFSGHSLSIHILYRVKSTGFQDGVTFELPLQ